MAQLGSALDWGSRGRRFESGRPDTDQRAYPIDGYALFLRPGDPLSNYASASKIRSMATAPPCQASHAGGWTTGDGHGPRRHLARHWRGGPRRLGDRSAASATRPDPGVPAGGPGAAVHLQGDGVDAETSLVGVDSPTAGAEPGQQLEHRRFAARRCDNAASLLGLAGWVMRRPALGGSVMPCSSPMTLRGRRGNSIGSAAWLTGRSGCGGRCAAAGHWTRTISPAAV